MTLRTPLILISGITSQLPGGDTVPGTDTVAQASGNAALVLASEALTSGNLGIANAAIALASGNAALVSAATAQASGNAALVIAVAALPASGGTLTGNVANTASGYFELPEGTTGERPASPSAGMVRFNTSTGKYEGYNGFVWRPLGNVPTGSGVDEVFYENDQIVTGSYEITSNKNAMSAGTISLASGVTVVIPSGSAWIIV